MVPKAKLGDGADLATARIGMAWLTKVQVTVPLSEYALLATVNVCPDRLEATTAAA